MRTKYILFMITLHFSFSLQAQESRDLIKCNAGMKAWSPINDISLRKHFREIGEEEIEEFFDPKTGEKRYYPKGNPFTAACRGSEGKRCYLPKNDGSSIKAFWDGYKETIRLSGSVSIRLDSAGEELFASLKKASVKTLNGLCKAHASNELRECEEMEEKIFQSCRAYSAKRIKRCNEFNKNCRYLIPASSREDPNFPPVNLGFWVRRILAPHEGHAACSRSKCKFGHINILKDGDRFEAYLGDPEKKAIWDRYKNSKDYPSSGVICKISGGVALGGLCVAYENPEEIEFHKGKDGTGNYSTYKRSPTPTPTPSGDLSEWWDEGSPDGESKTEEKEE